ncbi:hypothetical protein, partial [Flavihumibacter cheonanensis]|uniref:hypothetical protein n=1 Tax=Flavihumibacter cheonanensis TaxID=1442385 RepID=UPI001EF8C38C
QVQWKSSFLTLPTIVTILNTTINSPSLLRHSPTLGDGVLFTLLVWSLLDTEEASGLSFVQEVAKGISW